MLNTLKTYKMKKVINLNQITLEEAETILDVRSENIVSIEKDNGTYKVVKSIYGEKVTIEFEEELMPLITKKIDNSMIELWGEAIEYHEYKHHDSLKETKAEAVAYGQREATRDGIYNGGFSKKDLQSGKLKSEKRLLLEQFAKYASI